MVRGGFAGLSLMFLATGVIVAGFGVFEIRGAQRVAYRLAVLAGLSAGVSWVAFVGARNWRLVYVESIVFSKLGYASEFEFPGKTLRETFSISSEKGIDFPRLVEQIMRQEDPQMVSCHSWLPGAPGCVLGRR